MVKIQELTETIFTSEDFSKFREWIQLNMESITWQGKFKDEFEDFWDSFFIDGLSVRQIVERFNFIRDNAQVGPIYSWLTWLFERFISYVFIYKNLTIKEIAVESGIAPAKIAGLLRNFYLDIYPHLDEELSSIFQVGNLANKNLEYNRKIIDELIDSDVITSTPPQDEVMSSMEITLYEEWDILVKKIKEGLYQSRIGLVKLRQKANFTNYFKIAREIILLLVVGIGLTYLVQEANVWYEKYLIERISIYEPQYKWPGQKLKFKEEKLGGAGLEKFTLDLEDIDEVETQVDDREFVEDERFVTESEVTITSLEGLPKDFNIAALEHSSYEEQKKKSYRDSSYGNTKVYRVIMNSVDGRNSKSHINDLINKYEVTQVDYVVPGKEVPGGIYYNLFVPRGSLKEFMAEVMDVDQSTLYESRTRWGNPPGKNKVFIWIKNL
jgi:hypothetical protein